MMRDMSHFSYKAELFQMGTRGGPRKLLADARDDHGGSHIFSLINNSEEGAAIFTNETKRRLFGSILKDTITHPYISSPEFAQLRDTKAVVLTPYLPTGSLRDLIYITPEAKKKGKITPKSKHTDKYPTQGVPLDSAKIAKYGRQILEALFYLYLHGFPYPHLHSGNVFITENDHAQLTDLENSLLVLDPKYHREIKRLLAQYPEMAPEVISFGLLLFEMTLGHEKGDRTMKDVKAKCPLDIHTILEAVLEPTCEEAVLTLKSLLRMPFFQDVTLDVTVHQVVLTEKWEDKARACLKLVRASTAKILTPPSQPALRSSNSGINLASSAGGAASQSTSQSKSHSRTSSSSGSSSSSTSTLARKPSKPAVAASSSSSSGMTKSSSSNTINRASSPPPPAPPAGVPAPPPPPPPPPSMAKSMPTPQNGRDNLMASIRAAGGLKAVQKDK